jgi:hypothetical protein
VRRKNEQVKVKVEVKVKNKQPATSNKQQVTEILK